LTHRKTRAAVSHIIAAVTFGGAAAVSEIYGLDAYSPREIAGRVNDFCVVKAQMPLLTVSMLGVLAGAFIGLGALMFTLVASDPTLGFTATRLLGGLAFSLGLILVVVAGAELFTGNNMLAMAWADGCVSTRQLLRNWIVVCATNFVGAAGLALLVWLSGHSGLNGGAVGETAIRIATVKAGLPLVDAFFRGVLCNVLVCMAVWMALAGRSVTDKAVAIVFPITAFVAAGFEHSIANMYFFPLAMLLGAPLGGDFAQPVLATPATSSAAAYWSQSGTTFISGRRVRPAGRGWMAVPGGRRRRRGRLVAGSHLAVVVIVDRGLPSANGLAALHAHRARRATGVSDPARFGLQLRSRDALSGSA
jgi:formate/nitrite transporter